MSNHTSVYPVALLENAVTRPIAYGYSEASKELSPDVVILNISMSVTNGFETARLIRSTGSKSAIVILSAHKDQQFMAEAQSIGVQGFVAKKDAETELIDAIENAEIGVGFTVAAI